jgi:hypothetical protein
MSGKRQSIPPEQQRGALLALERYFVRAKLMERDYEAATTRMVRRAMHKAPRDALVGPALEQDSYFHLWLGSLRVVVDGWRNRLKCSDPAIDDLLDSELSPLFQHFRNSVFHFDPEYGDAPFNYAGEEALEWLDSLMEAFSSFFRQALGDESLVDALENAPA